MKKWLISRMLSSFGRPPIRFVLWDGTEVSPQGEDYLGTVAIRDPVTLLKLTLDPELHFGDAYTEGQVDVDGDLVEMLVETYRALAGRLRGSWYGELISRYQSWKQANSPNGSRRNIHRHYDIGTDFYKLWLDSRLLYTCAYYPKPSDELETAQLAKMDHVCRKVQLQPGDRVVEAGCGWGALAIHMAKQYGAKVRAFNISHEQIVYARRWAQLEGLSDRVEFVEDDYRNVSGKFDVFMSVGMLEHVGTDYYKGLGSVIHRSLVDHGRGFLHFIGRNRQRPLNTWIRKRIFPGACPPTLRQVMDIFETWDFSVLDIENLRLHYARTLEHWLERFERSTGRVTQMFSPEFVRAWRLYLAGSLAAFRTGSLQLFQISFTRGSNNKIPWTRACLYSATESKESSRRWMTAIS
jgi:cyclopropane-fatty-acyl-phospholipid synthase